MKKVSLIFLFIFVLINVSALQIVTQPGEINKTYEQDYSLNLKVKNEQGFTFNNITFEDNDYITMPTIPTLNAGETASFTATIKYDSNFNGDVKIIGYYETNVGSNYETHNVNINEGTERLDVCDISIVKGDKVNFINNIPYEVKLRNMNTNEYFSTLTENQSYEMTFDTVQEFIYAPYRYGDQYHSPCTITVLDDTGIIHNPEYDAVLNLDINQNYLTTSIEMVTLQTDYTMNFYDTDGGLMSVTNTGSNFAHNIDLNNEWFTFTPNNFDLDIGKTRTISYIINPFVTKSNETNKSYKKELEITGNFPIIKKLFNIFINYANIDSGVGNYLDLTPQQFHQYCLAYPEDEYCQVETQVVYKNLNASEIETSINWTQEKAQSFEDYFIETLGMTQEQYKQILDRISIIENMTTNTDNKTSITLNRVDEKFDETNSKSDLAIIMVLGVIILAILFFGIKILINRMKIKKMRYLERS